LATIDDAHLNRWNLIRQDVPYNAAFGIPTFWRQHPELGSPLGPELNLGNGITAQAFTGGVVKYEPGVGVTLVTE
jgi:hypothetical protein